MSSQIMWQLITQTMTEMPPQPTLLSESSTAGGSTVDSGAWTYGGMLANPEFDHYDNQLKFLVMWCLGKISLLGRIRDPLPGAVGAWS